VPTPAPPRARRRLAAAPALIAALAAVAPAAAAPATSQSLRIPGPLLFDGGWETGDVSQWSGCQTRHARGIRVVSSPRRHGRRAARFEVTDADNDGYGDRSECQTRSREGEGQVRWYAWSTYIPRSLPRANARSWAVITQWHCTCDGSPPVGFFLQGDRLELSIHRHDHVGDRQIELVPWGRPLGAVLGRWNDFRVRVRWSASDARGSVDLWVNGRRQRMNWPRGDARAGRYGGVGAQRLRVRTMVPGSSGVYLKQGLYRNAGIRGRAVVYHDGLRVTAG